MSYRFDVRFDAFSFFRVRYFDLDIFGALIFCVRFSPFDILCSLFCPFDTLSLWYFVFFSIFCLFDILPLRYIYCPQYFATSMFCSFDILRFRCFATSVFCLSIFGFRYFAIRYFAFRYFVMEANWRRMTCHAVPELDQRLILGHFGMLVSIKLLINGIEKTESRKLAHFSITSFRDLLKFELQVRKMHFLAKSDELCWIEGGNFNLKNWSPYCNTGNASGHAWRWSAQCTVCPNTICCDLIRSAFWT